MAYGPTAQHSSAATAPPPPPFNPHGSPDITHQQYMMGYGYGNLLPCMQSGQGEGLPASTKRQAEGQAHVHEPMHNCLWPKSATQPHAAMQQPGGQRPGSYPAAAQQLPSGYSDEDGEERQAGGQEPNTVQPGNTLARGNSSDIRSPILSPPGALHVHLYAWVLLHWQFRAWGASVSSQVHDAQCPKSLLLI